MQFNKGMGTIIAIVGIILMMMSVYSEQLYQLNSSQYYNIKEGGFIYGIFACIIGSILMFAKKLSRLKFLWGAWSCLFLIQALRLLPNQIFVSHLINSIEIFWGVLGIGLVLLIVSIWWKFYKIF